MGLHSIYVDDEVFAELQKRATALKDNPNSVLRKVLSVPDICSEVNPCCERRGEYNGFASGPTIFTCPKHCSCHD